MGPRLAEGAPPRGPQLSAFSAQFSGEVQPQGENGSKSATVRTTPADARVTREPVCNPTPLQLVAIIIIIIAAGEDMSAKRLYDSGANKREKKTKHEETRASLEGSLLKFMKKGGTKEAPTINQHHLRPSSNQHSARPVNQRLWYRPSSTHQYSARPVNQRLWYRPSSTHQYSARPVNQRLWYRPSSTHQYSARPINQRLNSCRRSSTQHITRSIKHRH
ncbi:uncharacterized protein [Pseudochaenichthys georgianus]|uniref:uncharacterized protein n=1 Tax=Pseudochaenichthys georgianus TaxID=52239 RepID=UPI0039C0433B